MSEKDQTKSEGIPSWISALTGLVSGAVAVAGLFMAQPDLITVVVPVTTLERVVERAEARQAPADAEAIGGAVTSAQPPAPTSVAPAPAPAPPAPSQSLEGGISVSLLSLANTPDAFVANLRISNESDAQVLIAGRRVTYGGEFNLSDVMGGSCPWIANGESLGTLPTAALEKVDVGDFKPVAARQAAVVTLIFNKRRCATPSTGNHPFILSGNLVVAVNDQTRLASVSFENISAASAS